MKKKSLFDVAECAGCYAEIRQSLYFTPNSEIFGSSHPTGIINYETTIYISEQLQFLPRFLKLPVPHLW